MKRFIHLAARLYPRQWRERYGPEFDALLDDVNPGIGDLFNTVKGALFMRFTHSSVPVTAATFAFVGLLAAGLFCVAAPKRYVTTERISVQASSPEAVRANMMTISSDFLSDSTLATLIETNGLYPIKSMNTADRLRRFRQGLAIMPSRNDGQDLLVSFVYPDNEKAQKVTAAFAQLVVDKNLEFEEQRTTDWGRHRPVQMHLAGPPQELLRRRNWIGLIFVGLLAGTLTGITFALMRNRRDSQCAQ